MSTATKLEPATRQEVDWLVRLVNGRRLRQIGPEVREKQERIADGKLRRINKLRNVKRMK